MIIAFYNFVKVHKEKGQEYMYIYARIEDTNIHIGMESRYKYKYISIL